MILTVTANPAVDVAYFVESFKMGEVHRPLRVVSTAGGKGLNVSRVAVTLGEEVLALGFIGGANGSFIEDEATRTGIRCAFTRVDGETRKNVDIIDSRGDVGELLEAGPIVGREAEDSLLAEFSQRLADSDIACASGSLPRGVDSAFYCRLAEIARGKGKKLIVDTSGKALEEVISAKPFMVKPNRDELSQLFGEDVDPKDALTALYEKGVECPFVTLGGDGGMLFDGREHYKFSIPRVSVKNTVGSGDSTIGGIAVGLCRGMAVRDAVRLGMAAGVANTQFDGSGVVSRELTEKFYKEITVEVL